MNRQKTSEPQLGDEAVTAAGSASFNAPRGAPPRAVRRRRLWPWLLLAAVLLVLFFSATAAAWLVSMLKQAPDVWHITLQGEDLLRQISQALSQLAGALAQAWPWLDGLDWHLKFDELSFGGLTVGLLVLCMGLVLAVLAFMTLLPMLVLVILAGAMLAVLVALVLAAAVIALALSPLWLTVLGLWWWLLRKPTATLTTTATPATAAH